MVIHDAMVYFRILIFVLLKAQLNSYLAIGMFIKGSLEKDYEFRSILSIFCLLLHTEVDCYDRLNIEVLRVTIKIWFSDCGYIQIYYVYLRLFQPRWKDSMYSSLQLQRLYQKRLIPLRLILKPKKNITGKWRFRLLISETHIHTYRETLFFFVRQSLCCCYISDVISVISIVIRLTYLSFLQRDALLRKQHNIHVSGMNVPSPLQTFAELRSRYTLRCKLFT